MTSPPVRRALVSVSDKTHLAELARLLVEHRVEVLSTGGSAKALATLGVAVVQVSDYTGSPEILDGRVKTLHPKIHGGILARPTPEHEAELQRHDIAPIDLVVVNLYPFRETTARPDCTFEDAIENIDIGGPSLLRAGAKNWERVAVVVDPSDYAVLAEALRTHGGRVPAALRRRLARKAFGHTAAYDAAVAGYLGRFDDDGQAIAREAISSVVFVGGEQPPEAEHTVTGVLRYGENPHQAAGFIRLTDPGDPRPGLDAAIVRQGKALSYNNLLDADAALDLVRDLEPLGPAAAVFKHATPCGAAVGRVGETLADVYRKARDADAESAFGGIVALSRAVDVATARSLVESFLEVVLAPGYDDDALTVLATKPNLRVLELCGMFTAADPTPPLEVRAIAGGLLVQREDRIHVPLGEAKAVTRRRATDDEVADLEVAWRVARHVRSNAIVLVRGGVTVGIGGGQTSRVEASRQASARAGERAVGAVLASDGFFPFPDGVETAAAVGVRAIVQPGGAKRDAEVIEAADRLGLAMIVTGERHFRH